MKRLKTKLYDWQERARKEDLLCAKCGRIGLMTVDHIIPVSFFSMTGIQNETYNDEWNFQYLCRACNTLKHNTFDFSDPLTFTLLERYVEKIKNYYAVSNQ